MMKYKVLVKGNNYKTVVGKQTREFGFHATRFVEANSHSAAKQRALQLVKEELDHIVFNNSAGNPAIEASQLVEVATFGEHDVPGSGFSWHMEGREQYL